MLIGVITDLHIYDEKSFNETIFYLKAHLSQTRPDVMVCLGDVFDCISTFIKHGQRFKEACYENFPEWIFIYGNHDGQYALNNEVEGWHHFQTVFPQAQARITFQGQSFISVGDLEKESNYQEFLLRNAQPRDIVLSHGPFSQSLLDQLEMKGITLALHGHVHVFHIQEGALKKLKQYSMICFRFGGRNNEPPCMSYISIKNQVVNITCQETSLPRFQKPYEEPLKQFDYPENTTKGTEDGLDSWAFHPALTVGGFKWKGGYGRLQHFENATLKWEKSFGQHLFNSTPLLKFTHEKADFLVVAGTWGKSGRLKNGFDSAVIIEAYTGEVKLYLPVVGVTATPVIQDGHLYIVGQWHEVVVVDLSEMKILWENTAKVSHPIFEWRDNRIGGGWCTNKPLVGKHVWVVNLRGDLIGFDKKTGQRKFVHTAFIQTPSAVAYSQIFACGKIESEIFDEQKGLMRFSDKIICDLTGQKVIV